MMRRAALFLVFFCGYLIVLAEVQRMDDDANEQIERLQLERAAIVAQ